MRLFRTPGAWAEVGGRYRCKLCSLTKVLLVIVPSEIDKVKSRKLTLSLGGSAVQVSLPKGRSCRKDSIGAKGIFGVQMMKVSSMNLL